MKENKKIIIYVIIAIIIFIGLIIFIKNSSKQTEENELTKVLDIAEVFEIDDIEKSNYQIEKKKDLEISSKYIVGSNIYELKNDVIFNDQIGKMIYVRESYNKLNIYQTKYKIDEYESVSFQVEEIIEKFKNMCRDFVGIELSEGNEELIGDDIDNLKVPIGESIYYKNSQYTSSYKVEGTEAKKEYEINVYKKDETIICELVKMAY